MQFRCLLTVALAAGALGATACSDDGGDPLAVTTTSAAAESSTTTEAPTTSTTLDFETEVKLAALALLEVRNEVLQQPDVARVAEYISEFCTCLEREREIIEEFAAQNRRWTGPAVEPLGIRIDRSDPDNPTFTLIARQPPGRIAGPAGEEVIPEVPLAPYLVSLIRDRAGEWRMNALDGIPSMEIATARQIIDQEGLP